EATMSQHTIEQAIADIRAGKLVIVADDESRENEGDLVGAAERVTPAMVNFLATHARGLVCLTLMPDRCQALGLTQMAEHNTGSRRRGCPPRTGRSASSAIRTTWMRPSTWPWCTATWHGSRACWCACTRNA